MESKLTARLVVDKASPIPYYYQIREQLRDMIDCGELPEGYVLPNEIKLAEICGVSRMTVRQALNQLAHDGLLIRERGTGTKVARPKITLPLECGPLLGYSELLKSVGHKVVTKVISQEEVACSHSTAVRLNVEPETPITCVVRVRLVDGDPLTTETSSYLASAFPGLSQRNLDGISIYELMEKEYGGMPDWAVDTFEISVATAHEGEILGVAKGNPVLLARRIAYDKSGAPIEYTKSITRSDRWMSTVRRSRHELVETIMPSGSDHKE